MPIRRLSDPVKFLKGVGPARGELLAQLGVRTAGDLLFYFPRDLAHLPGRSPVADCKRKDQLGQIVTVAGLLERCRVHGSRYKPVLSCRLADNTGIIDATWFNAGWMRGRFADGDSVVLMGKLRPGRYGPELVNPKIALERSPRAEAMAVEQWDPVYPANARITSQQVQQVVRRNLPALLRLVEEFFPPQFLRERKLLDRWLAVAWMHFPAMSPERAKNAPGQDQANAGGNAGEGDGPARKDLPARETSPARTDDAADETPLVLQPDLPQDEILARHGAARHRLAWDEAFLFQLALAIRRRSRQTQLRAAALPCTDLIRQRILKRFPFPLTAAQGGAIEQIAADLAKPVPMNRLLQGDVGSGKTVVALFAALLAVAHGRQAAIMAPTEILATQHFERIGEYLRGSRVRFALLTGSISAVERKRIHAALTAGELDLVVGTSALISEKVKFARLALAIIDEQHKFGVRQRAALQGNPQAETSSESPANSLPSVPATPGFQVAAKQESAKGEHALAPHTLVMTATPIPRSLALTVFGDLAVSVIDELPPGRGQTQTRVVVPANVDAAMDFIESRLAAGGQAFIVCPRVGPAEDDQAVRSVPVRASGEAGGDQKKAPHGAATNGSSSGQDADLASAEQVYRDMQPRFSKFGIALVHGQMDRDRQRDVLAAFAAGRVRVLVATTVVEVGVDVARANVMAVLSAERFGLAQLHQLRGRIGRSADIAKSYCLLFVSSAEQARRVGIMEQTTDGFRLAEEDLSRRGPGEFFGLAQHGAPAFVHVDLARDLELLRKARREAFAMVESDPALTQPRNAALRRVLRATYGDSLPLVDAG